MKYKIKDKTTIRRLCSGNLTPDTSPNYWTYNYKIKFYDSWEEKNCTKKGCVIATSTEDAFKRIKRYYIDEEDKLINIAIVERQYGFGDVDFNSLVMEEEDEEDWEF